MITLRDYQAEAIGAAWDWMAAGKGNPLLVEPTGSGKAFIIAELCRQAFEMDPGVRIINLVHTRELVAQNYAELLGIWPDAPAGVYSAGLGRRDLHSRLLFASIQSIFRKAYALQQCDIAIIDEAHLIPRKANTMYGKFLSDLKTINPHLKIIGLTATPFRLDSGMLHKGENAMFDGIAHETGVMRLIEQGYLCPPRTWRQSTQIDTTGVGTRMGEFVQGQLEAAAMDAATIEGIADRIVEAGHDRKGWIVFGVSIKHCDALVEALRARGFPGAGVYGETPKGERDHLLAEFKAQRLRFLVSKDVLTTGFNARHLDLIALCRPTKSTGLYIQMVGRGTRTSPETGKVDCLVLDFAGAVKTHGPFDDPFLPAEKGKGTGDAPYKECPECELATATATRICPGCGYEYPPPEPKVLMVPDEKPVLSTETLESDWLEITGVSYAPHEKLGAATSLRVSYQVGLVTHKEWVCLEHGGYPRTKAEGWWLRRASAPVPATVAEALERQHQIRTPSHLRIRRAGKYDEIAGFRFEQRSTADDGTDARAA